MGHGRAVPGVSIRGGARPDPAARLRTPLRRGLPRADGAVRRARPHVHHAKGGPCTHVQLAQRADAPSHTA